jgi:hypothetical protein
MKHELGKARKSSKCATSKDERANKMKCATSEARGETTYQVPQRDGAQLDRSLPLNIKTTLTTMNLKVNAQLEM